MKVVVNFQFPIEPFNSLVREGTAGKVLTSILESIKPEFVYFYAPDGCRGGTMVVNIDDPSQIPSFAEPLFLKFGARLEVNVAMSAEELARADIDKLGKKWG